MKSWFCFAAALLAMAISACTTIPSIQPAAHTFSTEGTDFWICFEKNYRSDNFDERKRSDSLLLQLTMTAMSTATVTIETTSGTQKTHINRVGVATVAMDTAFQVTSSGTPEKRAIHVTSDYPISLWGSNSRYQTTDAFTAIPSHHLGREYRVICFDKLSDDLLSQCAIIATEDTTVVTITPRADTRSNHKAGIPFKVSLSKGEVYQVISCAVSKDCDLTGTLIQANKNIAVFSGHNCAYVPPSVPACNHLVEQLLPIRYWGKHFGIGTLSKRSVSTFRVVAHEPDTRIELSNGTTITLGAGEHYTDNEQREALWLTANKPVMVAHYGQGFRNGDSLGDATMALIRPVEQFRTTYIVTPPLKGKWQHFINVTIPETGLHSLRLDGEPVDTSSFRACGRHSYLLGTIAISGDRPHALTAAEPFGIYCYGFGYEENAYDAYGNM